MLQKRPLIITASLMMLLLIFSGQRLHAQDSTAVASKPDLVAIGIGVGLDFGGIGANLTFHPWDRVGFFAGLGYALAGAGFNAGVKLRLSKNPAEKRAVPYLQAMYGYNAAVAVVDQDNWNKLFYGPSFGVGLDLRGKKKTKGYWSVALLLPIRKAEVKEYMDDLENDHGVEFGTGLLPVGFSIGYHFNMYR